MANTPEEETQQTASQSEGEQTPEEKQETTEEQTEEQTEESSDDSSSQSDYDSELERIEKEKQQKQEAFKRREEARKKEDDDDTSDATGQYAPEDVEEMVNKAVQEAVQGVQKNVQKSQVEQALRQSTNSDSEYKLAMHHYENTINPSGSINDDVENAVALANRHRIRVVEGERQRKSAAEGTESHDVPATKQKTASSMPQLSTQDHNRLAAQGFVVNNETGTYDKKLPSGATMRFNPKTGSREIVGQ